MHWGCVVCIGADVSVMDVVEAGQNDKAVGGVCLCCI